MYMPFWEVGLTSHVVSNCRCSLQDSSNSLRICHIAGSLDGLLSLWGVCCAVTLGDTPNFFGPQPMKQQEEEVDKLDLFSEGGKATPFIRSGHAPIYRQEWMPLKVDGHIGSQQHIGGHTMQQ